ncbi:hypothetical protein [Hymenobacter sp. 5414T-23]|uniref:hypothetical protein n=1 Tax=Hymenobacter sp. 5414T-23 TaxID=2932252 RepID=UPI001FD22ECD|nr:hypothetical protein [Hymenobacter sp. 5414T-23]UOQ82988.1 hypothetical protein MUN83_09610 [Hymenobacter sp. 5414T-23]
MTHSALCRLAATVAGTGCALLLACTAQPPAATVPTTLNKFTQDATLRQIATAQDERNTAALLPFLEGLMLRTDARQPWH